MSLRKPPVSGKPGLVGPQSFWTDREGKPSQPQSDNHYKIVPKKTNRGF
jgi:hypothetical protein